MSGSGDRGLEAVLPPGVRSRFVDGVNGLRMHVLEAGFETAERPVVLLLHGFPELAFSWRKIMPALAAAGFHVIAPDQRGYGLTTGWDGAYDGDVAAFRPFNLVVDLIALLAALKIDQVSAVIGHDFGSPIAAHCALIRPDIFRALVMMSAPFGGPPPIEPRPRVDIASALAALSPPRKHYQIYYTGRAAEADMLGAPQGLHAFLRAYFHGKSGDAADRRPRPLAGWSAAALAELPTYYVMNLDEDMAAAVAPAMPSPKQIAACAWLTEAELAVYREAFARTGFQGALNWYRAAVGGLMEADLRLFSGRTIDVPALFLAGEADWGVYQAPGQFEGLDRVCSDLRGKDLVAGAGHWVQQERPEAVAERLLAFLSSL